jgi:copper chaperone CopZ
MDHEDAKKVGRAAFVADGGQCASCVNEVIEELTKQLPQFDWATISEEVSQEIVDVEPNGEELKRMDYYTYFRDNPWVKA